MAVEKNPNYDMGAGKPKPTPKWAAFQASIKRSGSEAGLGGPGKGRPKPQDSDSGVDVSIGDSNG